MKSKLSLEYPQGDVTKLNFYNSWQYGIDPIFAARLAAADITEIASGYRSNEAQAILVLEAIRDNQGYYELNGGAYNANGQCMVAPAGASWHNYKVAVDVASEWAKSLTNEYLAPFGLFKPMDYEPWHIQPIETSTDGDMQSYLDACNDIAEVVEVEITTLEQALTVFKNKGVDIDVSHWVQAALYVKWFEELIIKLAKAVA